MNIEFESKEIDFNEDVILSWYVTSPINEYRVCLDFLGAINEDGEEWPDGSAMAYISINETKHSKRDILEKVFNLIENDMDAEIGEGTVMINAPDIRYSIDVKNESDYDSTLQNFHDLLGALSYVLLQEETMMDIDRKED